MTNSIHGKDLKQSRILHKNHVAVEYLMKTFKPFKNIQPRNEFVVGKIIYKTTFLNGCNVRFFSYIRENQPQKICQKLNATTST